ncbi:hypothetical protein BKH46_04740 [Helicobacter sp. 12S02634-8]|uniref:hypothetical protein n=1 Tax=Helicobacter sp. 12S02634-8 TaxID=1476199 RepID=UPI000BC61736|nr:hypothetical protein [Helicobacter sp. 12S02634-8]PAF47031.1 hypothetical protein BKH46_04740 [Helicobacter sp. 12S02634-8]
MQKLKNLFSRLYHKEFKQIALSLGTRLPACLFEPLPLPQSYAFFVIGTHGVGMHSLLYFLSLCKAAPPHPPPPHKKKKKKRNGGFFNHKTKKKKKKHPKKKHTNKKKKNTQ